MLVQREQLVSLVICLIAILTILGGYASFNGLATVGGTIFIDGEDKFLTSQVFDANVVISPITFLADETITLYLDNEPIGAIGLIEYMDENAIEYAKDVKSDISIVTISNPLRISLADYVSLAELAPGSHTLIASLNGEARDDFVFMVE